MDKEFFLNAAIPPALHFEPMSSLPVSSWQSLELNFPSEQPRDCYLNHNWEQSMEQNIHFDSAVSSLVSSPVAPSNSNISNDNFVLRELIGKLVNIGDSGEISPQSRPLLRRSTAPMTTAAYNISGNNSTNTSCYNTPLNSPPSKQQNSPIMDQLVRQRLSNMEHTTTPLNSTLTELSGDPGFVERAARFSCFGSRSFNGRTSQIGSNSTEFSCRSNPIMGNGKLARVSSTPSLQMIGSQLGFQENTKPPMQERTEKRLNSPIPISRSSGSSAPDQTEFANSYEQSPLSEQIPGGESGLKAPNDSNSRKRKAAPRGKSKEQAQSQSTKAIKVTESERESNPKRCRMTEAGENENRTVKTEAGQGNATTDEDENHTKSNQKPPEPPKDYIHVRARRGQATDSHSLAERVRREKISERMKLLQDLVPGCNKVTGKALMLDEIINYVQSLQRQVEFLSMKLASLDFETEDSRVETHLSKDLYQSNSHSQHPAYPVDSSTPTVYGHHHLQRPILQSNRSTGAVSQCSVELLDSVQYRNLGTQLPPPIDGFGEGIPQFAALCEDDLQSLVQMGFGKNLNQEAAFQSHSLQGSNQTSQMKSEF